MYSLQYMLVAQGLCSKKNSLEVAFELFTSY